MHIAEHAIELLGDKIGREFNNGLDAQRILGGHRGQHAQAIHTARHKGFEIGLNTGPTSTIRPGNGQGFGARHGLSISYTRSTGNNVVYGNTRNSPVFNPWPVE